MNTAWLHPGLLLRQFNQLARAARRRAGDGRPGCRLEHRGVRGARPGHAAVPAPDRPAGRGARAGPHAVRRRAGQPRRAARRRPRPAAVAGARSARRDCWSAADPTGSWGWPAATPTCWTCTATRGTGGSPARPWPRPPPATWPAGTDHGDDLAGRIELVRAAAEAGRPGPATPSASARQIWFTAYGSAEQVRTAEERAVRRGGRACRGSRWTAARTCCSAARPRWPRRCRSGRGLRAGADLTQGGRRQPLRPGPGPVLPRGAAPAVALPP